MKRIFERILLCVLVLSMVLSYNSVAQAQVVTPLPNRISGLDRYETAKAVSQEFNGGICNDVILTSGTNFPDALSASVLSKKLNAPIILADVSVSGSAQAMEYIDTHVPLGGTIYIIGGTSVVGTDIETTLKAKGYTNIVPRLAGQGRYDTNMAVVNEVNVPQGTPVFIASGENFPDALSVSSFAGSKQYPTLLVGTNVLPDKVNAYLVSTKPSTVYIAGGTSVVSQAVEDQIKKTTPNATIRRLAGNDRYDTAGVVVKEFASAPNTIYLANGLNFPDALAGGALAARAGDPILLVDNALTTMPPAIGAYLQQLRDAGIRPNVRALGGNVVVPEILIQQAEAVLDGKPPIIPPKGFNNPAFANSSQVFLVTADSTSTSYGTGSMYEKVNGQWVNLSSFPVRLGLNGISYTRVQNSGKTPAGILNILSAFGVADNPGSNYSYHKVSTADYWNLNDGSPTYNRLVTGNPGGDAEHLIDYPIQYKYALVTDWNYLQSAGKGGAIFIHVNGSGATGSCISLTEGNLLALIKWLNPSNNPKVLVVPNSDLSNYFY